MTRDISTKDEYIIVAGATDGIGKEYVKLLSKQYKVLGLGRNTKKLEELQLLSPNISVFQIDFAEKSLVEPKYTE